MTFKTKKLGEFQKREKNTSPKEIKPKKIRVSSSECCKPQVEKLNPFQEREKPLTCFQFKRCFLHFLWSSDIFHSTFGRSEQRNEHLVHKVRVCSKFVKIELQVHQLGSISKLLSQLFSFCV